MSSSRFAAIALALILSTPTLAGAGASTCDDFDSCFSGSSCDAADSLMGQMIGTVDGIGDLLCFVGDAKCSCFQQITADVDGVRFDQWATKVEEIISACGGSASGGRALSGVAFQAASDICTPRFDDDVRPVLDAACGSCHVMGSSGNFNFASGHSALVDVASGQSALAYVKAGDPDASYLLHKLRGTHLSAGGSGSQMPFGGMLPPADIDLVEAWIASGAQP